MDVRLGVHMRDLVINHCKCTRRRVVHKKLALGVRARLQITNVAKEEVGEDGGGDIVHAVVAGDEEMAAIVADLCGEGGEEGVKVLQVFDDGRMAGAEALE